MAEAIVEEFLAALGCGAEEPIGPSNPAFCGEC